MPSLLDRAQGYAAFAVRRALGKDMWSEIQALRREVDGLHRALGMDLRLYDGMTINNFGTQVGLDHRRRHHLRSSSGLVKLTRPEGLPYAVDLDLDIEELMTLLLADPDFLLAICQHCESINPG